MNRALNTAQPELSALKRLQEAKALLAKLMKRQAELKAQENELLAQQTQRRSKAEDVGELVPDFTALVDANPLDAFRTPTTQQQVELVRKAIRQLKESEQAQRQLISTLGRQASVEVARGAEGDRWRRAVRELAKAVEALSIADALVAQETRALKDKLPDAESLPLLRFPAGPLYSFEAGDMAGAAANFQLRVAEVDRVLGPDLHS